MDEVKITGVEQVKRNLETWVNRKIDKAKKAYIKTGLRIETQAKANITSLGAVDTGRLRGSLSTNWTESGREYGVITGSSKKTNKQGRPAQPLSAFDAIGSPESTDHFSVLVGTNVEYAPYIEFGSTMPTKSGGVGSGHGLDIGIGTTRHARPYLYPAFFTLENAAEQAVAKILQEDERLA